MASWIEYQNIFHFNDDDSNFKVGLDRCVCIRKICKDEGRVIVWMCVYMCVCLCVCACVHLLAVSRGCGVPGAGSPSGRSGMCGSGRLCSSASETTPRYAQHTLRPHYPLTAITLRWTGERYAVEHSCILGWRQNMETTGQHPPT